VTPEEERVVHDLAQALRDLLCGETPKGLIAAAPNADSPLLGLHTAATALVRTFGEASEFLRNLSHGLLDAEPPARNHLIAPFKQLHANLRHLTWQTNRVAKGDLNQHVDFMGEFSASFNEMIESLRQKRVVEEALLEAHAQLAEANAQLTESIQYARTIQTSFLPTRALLAEHFSEYFFIWKPKDLIGGDLLTLKPFDGGFYLGFMDCTGHGVPGAVMTMIAGASFDRAVSDSGKESPSDALRSMTSLVKRALNQHRRETESDDGLDMAVCKVEPPRGLMTFAGARIGLYRVQEERVQEMRPDSRSIGYKNSSDRFPFKEHSAPLTPNAVYYLITDGFFHQTGGPSGLPYGKKRFVELLRKTSNAPLAQQEDTLLRTFDEYRANEPQLDDVTALAFKI
jgi:phosphoserine phosphatase RsbU/P